MACPITNSSNPESYFVAVAPDCASWAIGAYAMMAAGLLFAGADVGLILISMRGGTVVVDTPQP